MSRSSFHVRWSNERGDLGEGSHCVKPSVYECHGVRGKGITWFSRSLTYLRQSNHLLVMASAAAMAAMGPKQCTWWLAGFPRPCISAAIERLMARSFGCWRIEGVGGGLIEIAAALNLRAQSCVKVELAVMSSPSLIIKPHGISCGRNEPLWPSGKALGW